jgi:acyl carrier protein
MRSTVQKHSVKEVHPKIKQIVMDQLDVDEKEIIPSASLVEDLNADSLDLVEYIFALEEAFKVEISDEDAEKITTVGETQAYLMEKGVL